MEILPISASANTEVSQGFSTFWGILKFGAGNAISGVNTIKIINFFKSFIKYKIFKFCILN